MCGIFGTINTGLVDQRSFKHAVDLLAHRGPDSQGIAAWERVSFGFNRLSVQDLSATGNQPMSLKGQGVHLVFNGEIYNYRLLKEELIARGVTFFSQTDTEVILHAYLAWGWDALLKKLEGMFAIGLYDERRQKVFLARDQFGQKPLFWARQGKGLIFASEIKAILAYRGHAQLDFLSSLNPLFTTGLSPRGKTMFEGVEQLDQGEGLVYDLAHEQFTRQKYFSVKDLVDEGLSKELAQYGHDQMLTVYTQALEESVGRHLISDAPLASLFSAGLDSSLITSVALRQRPVNLYHFESELLDYQHYAKFFADKYKAPLKISKGNDKDYIFQLPRMIYHYETVNKEDGVVLSDLCRRAKEDGIKVLLSGDTSDELFGGQPYYGNLSIRYALYSSPMARLLMKAINRLMPFNITRYTDINPLGTDYNMSPSGENFYEVPINCLFHQGQRLKEWQQAQESYGFIQDSRERVVQAYMLDEMEYRFQRYMIRSDRFGMMHSVEVRTPLLHPALVKLAVNTPSRWKMKPKPMGMGFDRKYIIKQLALKQGLPNEYVYRKKITTPHNSTPQITKILKKWDFKFLSEFMKIDQATLRHVALNSYDRELSRLQFAFVSFEVLNRLFIGGQSCEAIEEEFRKIMADA